MVRLRKNVKRVWAHTSPTPVYTPVPLSSMKHSQYDHPSQNLTYLSPSVFTPPSAHLQILSTSQPAPILSSSDHSQAFFQSLSSAPPPLSNPPSTSSLSVGYSQPLNIIPSCSLGLSPSVHDLAQLFQNLSLGPPPGFNPHFAHAKYQYTSQPSISFSGNMGLYSPTPEDDDMGQVEPPLGEPMDIGDSVAEVIQDDTTYIRTSAVSRNHFGICTSLPYPLIAQLHTTFPVCDSRPALYPETYHPLPRLPTVYDDLRTHNPSPEWSVIDVAHISSYPSTPVYSYYKTTLGCSINDAALLSPALSFDHSSSLREVEEQAALKWFAEEIACIRSPDSRPHSCLSESLSPSINVADLVHATHSPASLHLPLGPWRAVTTIEDAVRRMQRKQVLFCEQLAITQKLLGQTTPKARDKDKNKNTVQQSLRMRHSDHTRHKNSLLSPEHPNNGSGSFGGRKGKRVVERAGCVNGDRQMKILGVTSQVVPAAILKISATVLKVPATVFMNITSTVAKTYFAVTKGLKSAAGKIVSSRPRAKPPPEVIVIDDDDD